jgi:hypothetical protein
MEDENNNKSHYVVVTSINPPNSCMRSLAEGANKNNWGFIVVGDEKSPTNFLIENCKFISLNYQKESDFKLGKLLPAGHYSRKNIGYLLSIKNGANVIIDTDDDNMPEESFWHPRDDEITVSTVSAHKWVNILSAFTDEYIWPRGLPLEFIAEGNVRVLEPKKSKTKCCIQQGLVNGDPDVDAIYRLILNKKVFFKKIMPIALESYQRCPFNSQNTTWFSEAWPFLYLPSYCSFRMTDIWRSFIAQSYLLRNDYSISFNSPTVFQDRNPHNYMKDFEDEVVGYIHNNRIMKIIDSIPASKTPHSFMISAYESLIDNGFIKEAEMDLIRAWHSDLQYSIETNIKTQGC